MSPELTLRLRVSSMGSRRVYWKSTACAVLSWTHFVLLVYSLQACGSKEPRTWLVYRFGPEPSGGAKVLVVRKIRSKERLVVGGGVGCQCPGLQPSPP